MVLGVSVSTYRLLTPITVGANGLGFSPSVSTRHGLLLEEPDSLRRISLHRSLFITEAMRMPEHLTSICRHCVDQRSDSVLVPGPPDHILVTN